MSTEPARPETGDVPDEEAYRQVDDMGRAILEFVKGGVHSLREINDHSHDELTGRKIGGRFEKYEDLGLLEIDRPDGRTDSIINGERKNHQKSRRARLTAKGLQYFEWADDREQRQKYAEASFAELTERVQENTELLEVMEQRFEQFRRQVSKELGEREDDGR